MRRVKDRAASRRLVADTKAAAGFKALTAKTPVQGKFALEKVTMSAKAASCKKAECDRSPMTKKATVMKTTPVKTEADRVAVLDKTGTEIRLLYDTECDLVQTEHSSEMDALERVIDVKEAAWERANAEYKTSLARADASREVYENSVFKSEGASRQARVVTDRLRKFMLKLLATADSLRTVYQRRTMTMKPVKPDL